MASEKVVIYQDWMPAGVRRRAPRCVMVVCGLTMLMAGRAMADERTDSDFSDAIRVLSREQSQAESYVRLLEQFGKKDVRQYAKGIQLYADARAEFDGLLEQLKYNLKSDESLEASADFQAALENAVDRRVAFTSFISDYILGDDPGQKGVGAVILATAEKLLPAIIEAGTAIWQEYRQVKGSRQKEILAQLEALKWKPYHEISGPG